MARYIDADELLNRLPDDLPYKASVKRVLIQAPTADVVPKREVEKIFEDIKEIGSFGEPIVDYICMSFDELAELKKKYTEGEE